MNKWKQRARLRKYKTPEIIRFQQELRKVSLAKGQGGAFMVEIKIDLHTTKITYEGYINDYGFQKGDSIQAVIDAFNAMDAPKYAKREPAQPGTLGYAPEVITDANRDNIVH